MILAGFSFFITIPLAIFKAFMINRCFKYFGFLIALVLIGILLYFSIYNTYNTPNYIEVWTVSYIIAYFIDMVILQMILAVIII